MSDVSDGRDLIAKIESDCPNRQASSESEKRCQGFVRAEFDALGLDTDYHGFSYNTNLYAVFALHFGLATAASVIAFFVPLVALVLHVFVCLSYVADSTKRLFILRRVFPWRPSQNLLATLPADGVPSRRVVVIAHADAAFTGWLFHPTIVRHATKTPPIPGFGFLRRSMLVVAGSCLILAVLDGVWLAAGELHSILLVVFFICSVPPLLGFVLNLEVVLRNTLVPGANDNLTGCAAIVALARRLKNQKPSNVELVFVCAGSEEAGVGGSLALARTGNNGRWNRSDTIVVAIDSLSNGELRYFREGEIVRWTVPTDLVSAIKRTRQSEPRFRHVRQYDVPSGGTDAIPFIARGWQAVGLGCVDPELGAPRHYHRVSDTVDNLDFEQYGLSLDFIEKLLLDIIGSDNR